MKTVVIYHRADFDGIFCREIAKKFLGETSDIHYIGWDFGDSPVCEPPFGHHDKGRFIVMDLPIDEPFGLKFKDRWAQKDGNQVQPLDRIDFSNLVWIDHHKSSIDSHPVGIQGYRIDGVAACRLAYQWFTHPHHKTPNHPELPCRLDYQNRAVSEPLSVRLAGEYDIWDKRDPDAELFQHGLRSCELSDEMWKSLLRIPATRSTLNRDLINAPVIDLLEMGRAVQYAKTQENKGIIESYGFTLQWEGLTFLACNHARFNSHLFTAGLKPEHEALLGFNYDGKNQQWRVSLYHAPGKENHDLSKIAVKHGGGGHRGACGFTSKRLPFDL